MKVLIYKQMLRTVFSVVIYWNHFLVLNLLCLDIAGYGKGPGLTGVSFKASSLLLALLVFLSCLFIQCLQIVQFFFFLLLTLLVLQEYSEICAFRAKGLCIGSMPMVYATKRITTSNENQAK